jgi:uncharacterized circularly permuted ATP-grasp superfamily protein/uncharacterized alpha-E superfamily protein
MLESALAGYRPEPGRYDDLTDTAGAMRSHWAALSPTSSDLSPVELARRQVQAGRLFVAEGASHVFHPEMIGEPAQWHLDPVPYVISADEWTWLERGLAQRADLLDLVLRDLTGPRKLVRSGIVPPGVAFGTRRYLPAVDGVLPLGRNITAYSADIVRDAQGTTRVLRDHTAAPLGAGFALLNRTVLTRVFPEVYRESHVQPLTEWYARLRAALAALAPTRVASPRTVLLHAGVNHPSFVELSFLATHLGYNLVAGDDCTVRDGRVWLRALDGLEPIDVILRRVGDASADPLELGAAEPGGIAGLLEVARAGDVGIANSLGAGLVENLALHPFLDAACRSLLDEPLLLPSLETLWCGDPDARREIEHSPADFVLHDTDPIRPTPSAFGADLSDEESAVWFALIDTAPHRFVAQRRIRFATTPVMTDGDLKPGTVTVRAQVVRGPTGTVVLPGGQGRVVEPSTPVVNQASATGKDVWVMGDARHASRAWRAEVPVMPQVDLRASLPSRSAEALFWLGRNAERAEIVARMSRLVITTSIDAPDLVESPWLDLALAGLRACSTTNGGTVDETADARTRLRVGVADALGTAPGAMADSLDRLLVSAGSTREFLSTATWQILGELPAAYDGLADRARHGAVFAVSDALDGVGLALAAFSGLAMESIVRGPAWRFLDLGRRIERALVLLGIIEAMLVVPPPTEYIQPVYELLLATSESLVAYRRRYRSDLTLDGVCSLLIEDDTNPRALLFQLDRIGEHLAALPPRPANARHRSELDRAVRATFGASLLGAGYDVPGFTIEPLVHLLLGVRGPLLELDQGFIGSWFVQADVARANQGPRF